MNNLPSIKKLINTLNQIPFFASKNIYQIMAYFLEMENDKLEKFCNNLLDAKKNLIKCETCFLWKENNIKCFYCENENRNKNIICIVETWKDFLSIERTEFFEGTYHVLGGLISPLNRIDENSLNIASLLNRIDKFNGEIILAFNQNIEGDATAIFIANKIREKNKSIKISCLAKGIPIGSNLSFVDRLTMHKALEGRIKF